MRKTVAHRAAPFDVDSAIRGAGLVRTAVRSATLAAVVAIGKPVSHPEIAAALARGGSLRTSGYDRTSIFRALSDMVEAGLLRRVELGDHVWRFVLATGDEPAGASCAFQCDTCGRSIDFPNAPRIPTHPDVASVARVYLRGTCARCAKSK